jgi:hypothetical protein
MLVWRRGHVVDVGTEVEHKIFERYHRKMRHRGRIMKDVVTVAWYREEIKAEKFHWISYRSLTNYSTIDAVCRLSKLRLPGCVVVIATPDL